MKPVGVPEQNTVYPADQFRGERPAYRSEGTESAVTSCWEISDEDLAEIIATRRIYVTQLTFRHPLQPIRLATKFDPQP